jgi:hypothetical protein
VTGDATPTPGGSAARTTVATYSSYAEAERAVDYLSDQGFAVEKAAIVGTGLKTVEQIAGRLTVGRAALAGAGQGSMIGLFFALLFGIFFDVEEAFLGVLLYGLIAGAVFGATFGAIAQWASGGRRDFASVTAMTAERYDLQVDHESSAEAKRLLQELPPA